MSPGQRVRAPRAARTLIPLTLAAAAVLAGAGCGERSEPTGATVRLYPVSVQGSGDRPTVVSEKPRRIAAVGANPARTIAALGADRLLVGGDLSNLNGPPLVRRLKKLRPDLIVASTESDPLDLKRAGTATGAPVYIAPDGSMRQVEQSIAQLGLLADEPIAARRFVRAIETKRSLVGRRMRGVPTVRVFVDTGFFSTVSAHSLLGDMVGIAHGSSVAGASPEPGPFDLAALVRLDPQVYLATSDSGTTLRKLRENPKTKRLEAVRKGRFLVVPSVLVQPGPRIGEGLETVARLLHPDAFH